MRFYGGYPLFRGIMPSQELKEAPFVERQNTVSTVMVREILQAFWGLPVSKFVSSFWACLMLNRFSFCSFLISRSFLLIGSRWSPLLFRQLFARHPIDAGLVPRFSLVCWLVSHWFPNLFLTRFSLTLTCPLPSFANPLLHPKPMDTV